jgi:hypothetical protein
MHKVGASAVDFQSKYYKPPEEPPSASGSPPTATSPASSSSSPRPSTLPDQEAESGSLGKNQVTVSRRTVGAASEVLSHVLLNMTISSLKYPPGNGFLKAYRQYNFKLGVVFYSFNRYNACELQRFLLS